MRSDSLNWIICQIGARERYALARELHSRGQLAALCTDIWVTPESVAGRLAHFAGHRGVSFRERYDPDLKDACVLSEQPVAVVLQRRRAQKRGGGTLWRPIMDADRWLGARMARRLERSGLLQAGSAKRPPVVFSYSYAAREIFEAARRFGCLTVLGQIDPGPVEDEIVAETARKHGFDNDGHERPPQEYWDNWRKECALADVIIVNSQWSAKSLEKAGVSAAKIHIAPLAYEAQAVDDRMKAQRRYPASFTQNRPLELLFLGQIGVRKGIFELLEAMERLKGAPVKLTMVGPVQDRLRERFQTSSQVEWIGKVPYGEIDAYYKASDLFLLPTHSDGFALTQLEAQTWGLPMLVSRNCGEVVIDGVNGRLIDPVSAISLEKLIRWALANPDALQAMSRQAFQQAKLFTAARAVDALSEAVGEHL
ncbi:glycosyltransferase family 4 protein [Roseiarcaceae bacterium H3SJ34-1]|uniref:glycosyltransferase family 4 protein n=1 Tax=Terripilifer ovatus TaxID=3032367 RepID=UPI003AB98EA9|nr:glycosyltransferase family 4 protein [Roseiarcaceae bacterium H3SJ34-1]